MGEWDNPLDPLPPLAVLHYTPGGSRVVAIVN